jgi:CheY-like chemotaxis protein
MPRGPVLAISGTVECWIGVTTEGERRIVRVAGRLSMAHIPEMQTACADSAIFEVDLTDLVSADMAGIEALRRIRARGAILVGTPGYIRMKIESTHSKHPL